MIESCVTDSAKVTDKNTSTKSAALKDLGKTLIVPWNVELNDSTQLMEIIKNPDADMFNLEPVDMVDAINFKYPQIKLEWLKQEGKRAFVKIEDAFSKIQKTGYNTSCSIIIQNNIENTYYQLPSELNIHTGFLGNQINPVTITGANYTTIASNITINSCSYKRKSFAKTINV